MHRWHFPFVLSLSKYEREKKAPFDKLRTNAAHKEVLMLILSTALIRIKTAPGGSKAITVEGKWEQYATRIRQWFEDLGIESGTVRVRFGKIIFGGIPENLHQRIRNFLVNECPLR